MSQQTYQCSKCKGEFQDTEMEYEEVPDNMSFDILADEHKIPKCPRCGHLEFFGFKIVDIAF